MAPENPLVFYTLSEEWHVPEGTRRPVPSIRVYAEVQFDDTGADNYNIVKDSAVVATLGTSPTQNHTFTFLQPGTIAEHNPDTFPVVQVLAEAQGDVQISTQAEWVMQ